MVDQINSSDLVRHQQHYRFPSKLLCIEITNFLSLSHQPILWPAAFHEAKKKTQSYQNNPFLKGPVIQTELVILDDITNMYIYIHNTYIIVLERIRAGHQVSLSMMYDGL